MPFWKKKTSKYAPAYDHGAPPPQGGQAKAKFRKPWDEFKEELLDGMSGEFPQIDNGSGPKKTIYQNNNLRYDREKPCQSYGHPRDNFQNYSIQANRDAEHPYLNNMAQNSNGAHRVKPTTSSNTFSTFGGSTVANINIQQNSGRISPSRVIWAADHSAAYGQPVYVVSQHSNMSDIPGGMRQAGAVYHSNPFEGWPYREDPRNPYHGCQSDGTLPLNSQLYRIGDKYYYYINDQYVEAPPP